MNFDASASSTATVAVGMYYPTTLIGSSSSSSPSGALSFRRCSIRNCPHFVAEGSSNKMCEGCRGRHRIYASAKRARRKANDARSNDNSGPGTAEDWLGLNSVSDLQESQSEIQLPQSTDAVSPAFHSVPQQLSNWTRIDPHLFSTLSSTMTLPLTSHSTSELANALVMPVSTKKPSVDELVQNRIQTAAAVQGSAKDQAAPTENTNTNQDHLQGGEGDESMRVCSVRGCKQTMPDSSEYKMCHPCRVRYQKYGTAKRAKWKAKREKASLEVVATATANGNSDPESTPKYSGSTTGENLKEGDKDENSPPGPNFRVSADASEKIGNSRFGSTSVGAHIAVDDIDPVGDGYGGKIVVGDHHQVRAEDEENEARRPVETIRGAAQAVTDLQIGMDTASRTAQQPPHQHSASADTINLATTIVTTQGHLNPLTLSVPQLQPYPTIPMRTPFAPQPSSSSSTSTSAVAAAAKRNSLPFIHDQTQVPRPSSTLVQSSSSSDSMANGFSKFRVELLETAKAALANQSQNQGHVEGGNMNGVGMVMTASDMSLRSQVFGTGSGSGASVERVIWLAGSGKDNNATAEVGQDASTTRLLCAPGAVDGTDAGTSLQNGFRMDESTDKDAAVKDGAVGQSTVPSFTSMPKGKRKARSKVKDGAGQAPTTAVEPQVASTLTSGSLPPPVPPPPNSHPHYHHPYPSPYPYPYYPIYYPPFPGAHPYPYPYPPPPPHASQSSDKPSRKKKKKNGTADKDKDGVSVEMSGQGHGYGYGYGVGQPLPYGYPHHHTPLPPGTSLTQTGVWAYPAPHSHSHPGLVGVPIGGSNSNTNSNPSIPPPGFPGPSYAAPYAEARLPPPPRTHPPAASPPPQGSSQYGPYQYACGSQPYNGTPFPLGTPVMPVSYYSVGGGVGGSGGSNVSGTSTTTGTGSVRKDKGKQTEGTSEDGKGRQTWAADGGGGVEREREREKKGRQTKISNEPLDPSQQEPKQVQMQFSYYHYGPNGEVVETFSEGVRKKRRKVDPNCLEKLEKYRGQAREGAIAVVGAAVAVDPNHQPAVEPASASAPVPVPGFGAASSSLKARQFTEASSNSTSTSTPSPVHVNDIDDPDSATSPESPIRGGNGLAKQKEKQRVSMSVTQPCSNKSCTRHIVIDDASRMSDDNESLSGRVVNKSMALCGRCKLRFKKMQKRAKMRFRLVPRQTVLDRVGNK